MTTARWRILIGILGLTLGAAYLVLGVLFVVTLAIPRHGLDAPYAAYLSSFGLGWLAFGYGIWWGSGHRWPQVLMVLALSVSAGAALSQAIGHWEQPLNSANVGDLGFSLLSLFIGLLLPRLLAGDLQKRSRQRS